MRAEVYLDGAGFACYVCNNTRNDRDMFQMFTLPTPYNWMCSSCLAEQLTLNTISLRVSGADDELPEGCNECGDSLAGLNAVCTSCAEGSYDAGRDDALNLCDYCGDDGEVYCRDHAKSEWELLEPECSECSRGLTAFMCEACFAESSAPPTVTYAQAAEPIDVEWGDE